MKFKHFEGNKRQIGGQIWYTNLAYKMAGHEILGILKTIRGKLVDRFGLPTAS